MPILNKPMTAALLLAGAAGGPYVLYETDAGQAARNTATQAIGVNPSNPALGATAGASGSAAGSWWGATPNSGVASSPAAPALSVTQINSLAEVLRFDIPPAWVMQNFPTVNTGVGDLNLDGLRVPLITGTRPDDLVGTLTYYFDRFQRVQRISLHAVTGDPTRIGNEIQRNYRLQQQPALGGGLYTTTWNGTPTSILHITPATVITAEQQNARFTVFLEINQPGLQYGLSTQAQALIQAGKQMNRW
ncbi:MAG: DUF6690 family protein [Pirellulaceae bacterium]|nr:DUF6690 family protein [Pirellulaceae bacterium]